MGRRDASIKPAQVVQQLNHGTGEPAGMRPNPGIRQGEAVGRMKAAYRESVGREGSAKRKHLQRRWWHQLINQKSRVITAIWEDIFEKNVRS